MEIPADRAIAGTDLAQPLDVLFVNAPLRDYSLRPRTNDFTLPVLGMGYIYCQSALVLLLALLGWARWPSLRTRPDAWAPIARPRIPTRVAAEVRRQEQHTANFT